MIFNHIFQKAIRFCLYFVKCSSTLYMILFPPSGHNAKNAFRNNKRIKEDNKQMSLDAERIASRDIAVSGNCGINSGGKKPFPSEQKNTFSEHILHPSDHQAKGNGYVFSRESPSKFFEDLPLRSARERKPSQRHRRSGRNQMSRRTACSQHPLTTSTW